MKLCFDIKPGPLPLEEASHYFGYQYSDEDLMTAETAEEAVRLVILDILQAELRDSQVTSVATWVVEVAS